MRVAMIGAGYVGLVSGACFADFGHEVCCVDKDPEKIAALRRGEMPIFEPGLPELVAKNVREGRLSFATELAGRGAGGGGGVHRGRHAVPARRRPCRPLLRLQRGAGDRGGDRGLHGGGDEVDGAGRHRRRGRAAHPRGSVRCLLRGGLEPGIPARGRGDRRFQAPGPDRHRQRGRARRRGDARPLPAALSEPGADAGHLAAHGGTDEVCRQRLPRHQDHLHQRDRRPVREGRRQRPGRRPRHRPRQPHRIEVPACRARLRRLLLSKGYARPDQDRAGPRGAAAHRRDGGGGERAAQARHGPQGRGRLRRRRPRPAPSPCSG